MLVALPCDCVRDASLGKCFETTVGRLGGGGRSGGAPGLSGGLLFS